jgi:membrane fusion protein (multidrug efflux system)
MRTATFLFPGTRSTNPSLKRAALVLGVIAAIAGLGELGWSYWTVGRFQVSTDDAYVQADSTIIAPKLSGYIADVLVSDNEPVRAGQVLARIDDSDYRTALAQGKADVASAEAAVRDIDAQIAEQRSVVDQANAAIAADEAQVTFAHQEFERYTYLQKAGVGSVQQTQQRSSALKERAAGIERDRAALAAAREHEAVLTSERDKAQADANRLQAVEHQAELNLGYATIVAPIDGTVGARSLRTGQYVEAGTQLMAIVPLKQVYIVGNYKETQLTDVHPGQPVVIRVDTFPGATVRGYVDSLAPATGLEFALLPPDNATGNFTKIVQRIPVRIAIDAEDAPTGLLRPGMSVEPSIDTRPEPASVEPRSASRK